MATLKQIDANRRNALKSTGPKTLEGKAACRMNSLRHGLRARTVVLPNENPGEFQQLCDDLEAEWQPQTRTEQFYLEQMAVSQWKLTRMEVAEANVYEETATATRQLPLVDRLWQAQNRMERAYARAQRELERLQNSRRIVRHHPELETELETETALPAKPQPVASIRPPSRNHPSPAEFPSVEEPAANMMPSPRMNIV